MFDIAAQIIKHICVCVCEPFLFTRVGIKEAKHISFHKTAKVFTVSFIRK